MKMSYANLKAMPTKAVAAINVTSSKKSYKLSRSADSTATGPLLTLTLFLVVIMFCLGNLGLVDGLKCHMCGQYNEGVGSITPCTNYSKEIEHLYLKECTKKSEKFCVKYVSELSTVRDCATECIEKEIWETQTYCCTEDGCNSGGLLKYSIVLLTMPFFNMIWPILNNYLKMRR